MQRLERLGHRGVVDMSDTVQIETVGAHTRSGRSGFDPGEIDATGGEFGERAHQRARFVEQLEHDRGPVRPGRGGRRPRPGDQDEAGERLIVVGDTRGQRAEPEARAGQRRRHRGVGAALGDILRGGGIRGRVVYQHLWQLFGDPLAHLRTSDRIGGQQADVGQGGAGPGQDGETHLQFGLGDDLQSRPDGQRIQRRRDRALHRTLDRHHGGFDLAGSDQFQRRPLTGRGDALDGRVEDARRFDLGQSHLGEGS